MLVSFPTTSGLLTNDCTSHPNISGYYTPAMMESDDSQVKGYLTGKVRHSQWMVKAIEQRSLHLMACGVFGIPGVLFSAGGPATWFPCPGRRGRAPSASTSPQ